MLYLNRKFTSQINGMIQASSNKAISALFIFINFILLLSVLYQGDVEEDDAIRNFYMLIVYIFVSSLVFSIYYRQNRKTFSFWLTAVLAVVFILSTLLYMYFLALANADWR